MGPLHILALLILIEVLGQKPTNGDKCAKPSLTKVSGTKAPKNFCSGDVIFYDEFNHLDTEIWQHEHTLAGAGNGEFQLYNNNRSSSYGGSDYGLVIEPWLLADQFGEDFLSEGTLDLNGALPAVDCTADRHSGCERTGTPEEVLNPIMSASLNTYKSFSFQYGKIQVQAMMAAGDWLWSAIWMAPTFSKYGGWPASGEIDIAMSRGNRQLMENGINIGIDQVSSALHFGPYPELNMAEKTTWTYNNAKHGYKNYQMEWTPDYIKFSVNDIELGTVKPQKGGFWKYGNFRSYNIDNPWKAGSKMAPFDQKFYLNINLACGGTSGYFKSDNKTQKPWNDDSPSPMKEFWEARSQWLPTWDLDKRNTDYIRSLLMVDSITVWAL